ncbi:S1/P1 nuclease [Chitinophaga skermanii]|uniref:S1/P1 nuclease n=1 Tax=Chitinophaga skermanii TaxID=331697 RepID=A0A327R1R8_9BACT|nr:zinc dependent phospholipase C family protein [Chitinophaga skermanii]RAJ10581.1 S1/P1 nuclease [Chitinophaga skermanii]
MLTRFFKAAAIAAAVLTCTCMDMPLAYGWGFFAHQRINRLAVYMLPPGMMAFFKPNIEYIVAHACDPDKRRYLLPAEGPRHYIDIDRYGAYPYDSLPRIYNKAVEKFSADTLQRYGILPWHFERMMARLTKAFDSTDATYILRTATELGHYIGDAHVPLHASSNHNGQFSNQHGIHALWESRIPELLADMEYDFWLGKAVYIHDTRAFIWRVVMESALAADSVLQLEKKVTAQFSADVKYSFTYRNALLVRGYSDMYVRAYAKSMGDMVERRMRNSIFAVASCWYTAWINAGQPTLSFKVKDTLNTEEKLAMQALDDSWRKGKIFGRGHE